MKSKDRVDVNQLPFSEFWKKIKSNSCYKDVAIHHNEGLDYTVEVLRVMLINRKQLQGS